MHVVHFHRTATYGDPTPLRIGDVVTLEKADRELEAVESRIDTFDDPAMKARVGRGERIVYRVVTDDLSAFGATLSLKYGFRVRGSYPGNSTA